jgi:hypothetical protein
MCWRQFGNHHLEKAGFDMFKESNFLEKRQILADLIMEQFGSDFDMPGSPLYFAEVLAKNWLQKLLQDDCLINQTKKNLRD